MNIKQKVRIKIQQKNIDILGIKFCWCEQIVCFIYPNQNNSVKRFNGKNYHFPKGIIKSCNITINAKNYPAN